MMSCDCVVKVKLDQEVLRDYDIPLNQDQEVRLDLEVLMKPEDMKDNMILMHLSSCWTSITLRGT